MTSQYAYAALNATNLQAVNDAEASSYDEETEAGGSPSRSCCRSNILSRIKDVVQSNIGLLLIVASQAFMSFMNVSVKKLNSLDTPVPTLEVSSYSVHYTIHTDTALASSCKDGKHGYSKSLCAALSLHSLSAYHIHVLHVLHVCPLLVFGALRSLC